MVALTDKFPQADLFTTSKALEDFILTRYPGKIMPCQYGIDTTDDGDIFCFYNLFYPQVKKFLRNIQAEYEIRDSKTGEILDIKRI